MRLWFDSTLILIIWIDKCHVECNYKQTLKVSFCTFQTRKYFNTINMYTRVWLIPLFQVLLSCVLSFCLALEEMILRIVSRNSRYMCKIITKGLICKLNSSRCWAATTHIKGSVYSVVLKPCKNKDLNIKAATLFTLVLYQ